LSGGRRQSHIRKDKNQLQQAQHRVVSLHTVNRFGQYVDL
jgi:hypothetical protein